MASSIEAKKKTARGKLGANTRYLRRNWTCLESLAGLVKGRTYSEEGKILRVLGLLLLYRSRQL